MSELYTFSTRTINRHMRNGGRVSWRSNTVTAARRINGDLKVKIGGPLSKYRLWWSVRIWPVCCV